MSPSAEKADITAGGKMGESFKSLNDLARRTTGPYVKKAKEEL